MYSDLRTSFREDYSLVSGKRFCQTNLAQWILWRETLRVKRRSHWLRKYWHTSAAEDVFLVLCLWHDCALTWVWQVRILWPHHWELSSYYSKNSTRFTANKITWLLIATRKFYQSSSLIFSNILVIAGRLSRTTLAIWYIISVSCLRSINWLSPSCRSISVTQVDIQWKFNWKRSGDFTKNKM